MTIAVSSLSVAVQGIADFLDNNFTEEVMISVDTPLKASEKVKGGDKHLLNLFAYRVIPSGFYADTSADDPFFIRINALLTPFLSDQDGSALDADLRILGHAIRVLHSQPVLPGVLPGNSADPTDFRSGQHLDYRLQSIMQAPSMEELNNIWTTQGGELAYRLSAAYEFALIPIEPLKHRVEAGPVTTSVIDVHADVEARTAGGIVEFGESATTIPLGGRGPGGGSPPTDWLPVVLFVDDGVLANNSTVVQGASDIDVAIAGPPGERVALEVSWVRANGSEDTQAPQVFSIATPRIDDPTVSVTLDLDSVAAGDVATVLTRPVDGADQPLPTSPFANTLTIVAVAP